MAKDELIVRLYFDAALHELARLVGYAGLHDSAMREPLKALIEKHGERKMAAALQELTFIDKANVYQLRPEARRCCYQLLGPPPDHPLADYLRHGPSHLSTPEALAWQREFRAKKAAEQAAQQPAEPQPALAPNPKRARKKAT